MALPSASVPSIQDGQVELATSSFTTSSSGTTTDSDDAEATPSLESMVSLLKDSHGLSKPIGIAVDHARNGLYVADYGSGKILRWTLAEDTATQKLSVAAGPTEIYSG